VHVQNGMKQQPPSPDTAGQANAANTANQANKAEKADKERPAEQREGLSEARRGSPAAPSDKPEGDTPHPQDVNEIAR
jgi:hypothetical protein